MAPIPGRIRIDKWLWTVRLFKTRSQASASCAKGKIRIGDQAVKASRLISAGETIEIRKGAFTMRYQVLQLTENRVPAAIKGNFIKDLTSQEELGKIRLHALHMKNQHENSSGRPSKKDRRDLNEFLDY